MHARAAPSPRRLRRHRNTPDRRRGRGTNALGSPQCRWSALTTCTSSAQSNTRRPGLSGGAQRHGRRAVRAIPTCEMGSGDSGPHPRRRRRRRRSRCRRRSRAGGGGSTQQRSHARCGAGRTSARTRPRLCLQFLSGAYLTRARSPAYRPQLIYWPRAWGGGRGERGGRGRYHSPHRSTGSSRCAGRAASASQQPGIGPSGEAGPDTAGPGNADTWIRTDWAGPGRQRGTGRWALWPPSGLSWPVRRQDLVPLPSPFSGAHAGERQEGSALVRAQCAHGRTRARALASSLIAVRQVLQGRRCATMKGAVVWAGVQRDREGLGESSPYLGGGKGGQGLGFHAAAAAEGED